MSKNLIKQLNELVGSPNYTPYNLKQTIVSVGVPQIPIKGLHSFSAWHTSSRRRLVMSMTGDGVFVHNKNTAGVVEISILAGSASCAEIQIMQLTGIPFPIVAVDTKSNGTSSAVATACQLIQTPPWRRGRTPGITVYTFETPRLVLSHGVRGLQ